MFQRWRSHKAGWRSSKIGTRSSHFVVLGKVARCTWKQLAWRYRTSAPLLMRTQRRMCSTWMKLASVGISKPTTRWQPISWKAGRSTRSASLLSFAQTRHQREDSVDDHRQALESMLFQGYQPRYAGRPLSCQCKGVDDPERLSTLAAGLWSPDARSPSPPFARQLPGPNPLGEVCGDERGPSQHLHFLPATKHDLGSPTLRCWDHTHIQSVLQKAIQQPTFGWLREQHRQSEKDQHFGCVPPSSPILGGGCFACHNRQLLSPLQNPD